MQLVYTTEHVRDDAAEGEVGASAEGERDCAMDRGAVGPQCGRGAVRHIRTAGCSHCYLRVDRGGLEIAAVSIDCAGFHVEEKGSSLRSACAHMVWVAFCEVVPVGWEQDLGTLDPGQALLSSGDFNIRFN